MRRPTDDDANLLLKRLCSHLETVGNQLAAYFKGRSGEGYDAVVARIRG